jgi:hypothetical protein
MNVLWKRLTGSDKKGEKDAAETWNVEKLKVTRSRGKQLEDIKKSLSFQSEICSSF